MKPHLFLATLLAGAISGLALAADEQPRQSRSDDPQKVNKFAEEESNRLLNTVGDRCRKMLDAQIAINDATKALHRVIEDTADGTEGPEELKACLKLAAEEKEIIDEAAKIIEIVEASKVAVAFPEFFRQVRKDMRRVQDRLTNGDAGADTQAVEYEIIQGLREMIASLRSR
jgi:hypothetical protein